MYRAIHVDQPEFTDELWMDYYNLLCLLRDRYQSTMAAKSVSDLKRYHLSLVQSEAGRAHFVICNDTRPVGWVQLRVMHPDPSSQPGQLWCNHPSDSVSDEYAIVVAGELRKVMDKTSCRSAICEGINPQITSLMELLRARQLSRINRFRLERSKANHQAIDRWLKEFPEKHPSLRIEHYLEVPEDILEEFLRLLNQFIIDVPDESDGPIPQLTGDDIRARLTARKKIGLCQHLVVLYDGDGRMIGHSNGSVNRNNPESMYQAMTGIVPEYRGQSLSKWLKAALFRKVGELYPENTQINTDMRSANAPILTVNAQMGFELLSEGYEYLIEYEKLESDQNYNR